jgi:pimeloyl-ACP methyl ester carboxylesterase
MKIYIKILVIWLLLTGTARAQVLISSTLIQAYSTQQVDSVFTANSLPSFLLPIRYGVDIYRIEYNTVGIDSLPTIATGALLIPHGNLCKLPLISYQHGTLQKKTNSPSFNKGEIIVGVANATDGFAVCIPDYLGLGSNLMPLHPFLHAQSEATASIDMMRASREFFSSTNILLNEQVFLVGYSQGGHATLALQKLIEENFLQEFNLVASAAMSGPYDLSETQVNRITADTTYALPSLLPFLLFGLNPVYNFFSSPSNVLIPPYNINIPGIMTGNFSIFNVNSAMPSIPNNILIPAVLDSFRTDTSHYFRVALRQNDVYNFTPVTPTRLFYCSADEIVPYQNSLTAYNKFLQNGSTSVSILNVSNTLNHNDCAQVSLLIGKVWLDSLRTDLISPNIITTAESVPGSGDGAITTNVAGGTPPYAFMWNTGSTSADITGLNTGTYVLTITDSTGCFRTDSIFIPLLTSENEIVDIALEVFPNPATDIVYIKVIGRNSLPEISQIHLINMLGSVFTIPVANNSGSIQIDVSTLPAGLYRIQLLYDGFIIRKKMVVIK